MRRSSAGDWVGAVALALGLHLALVLLIALGLLWDWWRPASPAAGGVVSAELVDGDDLSAAMRKTLRDRPEPVTEPEPLPEPEPEPEPEPLPEPVQEQPRPQDFIPVPDEVDQVEVTEDPTALPAREDKVQEAKQRQAQVDLTEQQRQQEAQRQERLTEMERQRQKQIADIQRRRAAASREAELAEQRLQQIANARARNAAEAATRVDATASGAGGDDDGLQARYIAAITAAVEAKWIQPDGQVAGARCKIRILQLPGGQVRDATAIEPCSYNTEERRAIEAAVKKASPLPYRGFEEVFNRAMEPTFIAD